MLCFDPNIGDISAQIKVQTSPYAKINNTDFI